MIYSTKKCRLRKKTKTIIIDANTDSDKITYQRHSDLIILTKIAEKLENFSFNSEEIEAISRHYVKKLFSRCTSCYNFGMFKILNVHAQGISYSLASEEHTLPCKVIVNIVLIKAFAEYYSEFLEKFNIDVGDGINVSNMILRVGLVCHK